MKKLSIIILLNLGLTLGIHAQLFNRNKPKPFDKQMKALTGQMVKSFSETGKNQIAIMGFPDVNGKVTELGKLIPEELTTRLFKTGEFQVIERQLLTKVLEEQKLGISGMLDAGSVAQLGKLLGVDAIVTGTVTDRGDAIRINARMIETEQAQVFAVASVSIIREANLVSMLGKEVNSSATVNTTSRNNSSSEVNEATKAIRKGMIGNVKVEIMRANITPSQKIKIEVVFTNKSRNDLIVKFYNYKRKTKLFDNMGQEFGCSRIAIGSKKSSYDGLEHRLIKDLPTRAIYTFDNIDQNATRISLFKLVIKSDEEDQIAEFRKIDLAK
ncbi:MAG: FlgO family outer membrane protein [Bacilli bacterium]|nr:FlgO family outer membrane protein [Bacteroidales bacterium]MDD4673413.1 FlgO family outer membrane protein [Bacteroidales bacterium]